MVCTNCARIIQTTGRIPPHFKKTYATRTTCPEPGGGKYAEMIRKQKLAELPQKYRDTKRKLDDASKTIDKLQRELDHERKRVRIPTDSTCPICLDTITDSVGFITSKCNHLICAPCYTTMVSRLVAYGGTHDALRCPTCRTNIICR